MFCDTYEPFVLRAAAGTPRHVGTITQGEAGASNGEAEENEVPGCR